MTNTAKKNFKSVWKNCSPDMNKAIRSDAKARNIYEVKRSSKRIRYTKTASVYKLRNIQDGKFQAIQVKSINKADGIRNIGPVKGSGFYAAGKFDAERVILCEGPEDAISLRVLGVDHSIFATMGVAGMINYSPHANTKVVIIFADRDETGIDAAFQAREKCRSLGLICNIIDLPDAKDPNDFLMNYWDGKPIDIPESAYLENLAFPQRTLKKSQLIVPVALNDLMLQPDKKIEYIVPGRIPVGLTLIAGAPKIGKSLFSIHLCYSVAMGGKVLDRKVKEKGDVLLLALEDSDQRIKDRFRLVSGQANWKGSSRISTYSMSHKTQFPELDKGGLEFVREWCKNSENPKLVVIDVLEKVKPSARGRSTEYKSAYDSLGGLHSLSQEKSLSVLGITHTRKSNGKEVSPFETIMGSTGLAGVADNILVLQKSNSDYCTLYGRGRDMPEYSRLVKLQKNGIWKDYGKPGVELLSRTQKSCLDVAKKAKSKGVRPKCVSEETSLPVESVQKALKVLVNKGLLVKKTRGLYVIRAD